MDRQLSGQHVFRPRSISLKDLMTTYSTDTVDVIINRPAISPRLVERPRKVPRLLQRAGTYDSGVTRGPDARSQVHWIV
eukprot:6207292-Pleurochrysis_carterae.AAC.1